jgi:23S rRNA pseudouridine955/2504/2580 synthase
MPKINFKGLILFEDKDYIVINKPSYISTLNDRNSEGNSIIEHARKYIPTAQVNHRLDKETSGALAIAKNPAAYRELSIQFEDRKVEKVYHAVAEGLHNFIDIKVDAPILPLVKGFVRIDFREGKPAETVFNTLNTFKRHSLIECKPITGRMHQIRVHLSHIGAPIVSDHRYGGKPLFLSSLKKHFNLKKETEELPLIKRVALHARALSFKLLNKQPITVEAPYPKDLAVLLSQLEKNL